ncbi:hypothetical protein BDZ97DRAFT_266589 [Flammula alnicola]|nr:hypothetical protein BDZ97DRAFT_266589 [Flammula alnicola]
MSSYPTTNSSLVDLPSINEVYRLAYSPERYGKRPLWASPSDHLFFRARLRLMPHRPFFYENSALLDDSSDDETSGCSSGSRGHDGALERLTKMPVDILYEVSVPYLLMDDDTEAFFLSTCSLVVRCAAWRAQDGSTVLTAVLTSFLTDIQPSPSN